MLLLRATRNRFPPSQSNLSFGEGDIIEINKTHDGQDGDGSMSMNLKQVVMATMSHKLRSDPFWLAELKNSVLVSNVLYWYLRRTREDCIMLKFNR